MISIGTSLFVGTSKRISAFPSATSLAFNIILLILFNKSFPSISSLYLHLCIHIHTCSDWLVYCTNFCCAFCMQYFKGKNHRISRLLRAKLWRKKTYKSLLGHAKNLTPSRDHSVEVAEESREIRCLVKYLFFDFWIFWLACGSDFRSFLGSRFGGPSEGGHR